MSKPKSTQQIWERIQSEMPPLSEDQKKAAAKEWLQKGAEDSARLQARAANKAIFDDEFYREVSGGKARQPKAPKLRHLWITATAVAALLALGFFLYFATSPKSLYPEIMQLSAKTPSSEVTMLGGHYQVHTDLSELPTNMEAGEFIRVAIPENTVEVTETGQKEGVSYYKVQQENESYTVLTSEKLPEVGEKVSFNAKLFWVSQLGKPTPILVEEVRHEAY